MRLNSAGQLVEIAAIRPQRKESDLLFTGEGLQIRVLLEKAMKSGHEIRASRALEIDERQIVVDHADFFEAPIHSWTGLGAEREHMAVHFGLLHAGAPQRFPPGCDGKGRFSRQPDDAFLIGNFVGIWLEKAHPPKIIQHIRRRPFCSSLSERTRKVELPFERRPSEGACRALNGFAEISALTRR